MSIKKEVVKTVCRSCYDQCGVLIYVKDGRIVKIEGDPDSPTEGTICAMGIAAKQLVYSPQRITHPLKRVGKKGEGRWQRISWDKALTIIADKFNETKKKYGPEAIAIAHGTDRDFNCYAARFANVLGTPNYMSNCYLCWAPRCTAAKTTFGTFCIYADFPYAKTIVTWGSNPLYGGDMPPKGRERMDLIEAKYGRSAKLIVVDPRFTKLTEMADVWLQLRPGTDCALALGILNVVIQEALYDEEFINRYTVGFDELREHVLNYPPKKVEEITWVPAEKIKEAARLYAKNKPSCIRIGVAVEHSVNGFDACRAIYILAAITGNYEIPGGNIYYPLVVDLRRPEFVAHDRIPSELRKKRLGLNRCSLMDYPIPYGLQAALWHAILHGDPYPIKAIYMCGHNPIVSSEKSDEVKKALMKVEFFAIADMFMTPTAQLSDIFLPAATWLEKDGIAEPVGCHICARRKVVQIDDCRTDYAIFPQLCKKLCIDYGWDTEEEGFSYQLKPLDITFNEFKKMSSIRIPMVYKKYDTEKIDTPSRKIEIYSETLGQLGLNPLPTYKEPCESHVTKPELAERYPLILTTGSRYPVYFHSEYRQLRWLREIVPENEVEIHPNTAMELGVKEGEMVDVETIHGTITVRVKVYTGIHPKCVNVRHGWWHPMEANVNRLTDHTDCDPATGDPQLRGLPCRVQKAKGVP